MVYPLDVVTGPAPLTVIWAILEDPPKDKNAPAPPRASVAHWNKINYVEEKNKVLGPNCHHPPPDCMGDIVDPRSGKVILNATVEGRLLGQL
jgi:hypothetical protein